MPSPSRREAIITTIAATIGLPLASAKETDVKTANMRAPSEAPESSEPVSCFPAKNSAYAERIAILFHAILADCETLREEHGEGCDCDHCDVAGGAKWTLSMLASCFTGPLSCFCTSIIHSERQAKSQAEVAARLRLPAWMVEAFVRETTPARIAPLPK